jgi:predicted N-acyltransferase
VPFTPVPGRRLLTADPDYARTMIAGAEALVRANNALVAHATFIAEEEVRLFEQAGWLIRIDSQFHWHNEGYADFDEFLASLSSRKRKAIRKERRSGRAGTDHRARPGDAITEVHWDAFWRFYQDTGAASGAGPT